MTADQRLLVVGLYISSTLYLGGCMLLGWAVNRPLGWKFALASAGACYICYLAQLGGQPLKVAANIAFFASIALGIAAGLALL